MTLVATGGEALDSAAAGAVTRIGGPILGGGVALAMAVLLLAGCPADLAAPGLGAAASKAVMTPPPRPAPKPAPAAKTVPDESPAALPTASPTPPERLHPETLVGLDERQTRELLGSPVTMEDAAPARVWRYASGSCTLDVFFFMDMTSQDFRALSYDLKSSENAPNDERCFATLLAQNWGGGDD